MRGAGPLWDEPWGDDTESRLDATAIELATGLSIADVETLSSHPSPEVRADISVKFAREFDRLAKGTPNALTREFLKIFAKDRTQLVRMCFAEAIKSSTHLPLEFADELSNDVIDVATPMLRSCPVLTEEVLHDIILTKPEPYSLAIADRQPLSASIADFLIAHKGTKRVVVRVLDNHAAEFSHQALSGFHEWGKTDRDIASRLRRRPDLPFDFVNQHVTELADRVHWRSLGERRMTKYEASQLQDRFQRKTGQRYLVSSNQIQRLLHDLREDFEQGRLEPSKLLAFLHDRDVDRLECALSVMTGLELQKVRSLLHGSDRRGLTALCLKADFTSSDYLAFRMALGLSEIGTLREEQQQRYSEATMMFAWDQFERMRADPRQMQRWLAIDIT
ncbi:MAG: DUF2336 domain-containing protein [Pseudomonadota bacterium]